MIPNFETIDTPMPTAIATLIETTTMLKEMFTQKSRALSLAVVVICSTFHSIAFAQSVTRLTYNQGTDIYPTWDPRGSTIAYIRPKTTFGSVFDAYKVSTSGQGGEQIILQGLNTDFGVAVGLSWIGSTGSIAVEEAISGFEVLKFDTSQAPFSRTVANGSDAATQLLLSINGGGGGGLLKISRDGTTALIRISTSGSGGNVAIRSGLVSTMTGQVSSAFGTALISVNAGSSTPYLDSGAINKDGSTFVLAEALTTSTATHDLFLGSTSNPSQARVNLTNTAASGMNVITPEFSPDGSKIVFARWSGVQGETYDLYMINVDGTGLTQLTNTPHFSETYPSWSPDGSSIAFQGVHLTGFESEAPALESGEAVNNNIYILTLPATNIVTPKTPLVEPPAVTVEDKKVTFTCTPFAKARPSSVKKSLPRDLESAETGTSIQLPPVPLAIQALNFTFQYELVITKDGGSKKDIIRKTSKRNILTVNNIAAGSYSAKYRVKISKKKNSKITPVGATKFSPTASFSVG